MGKRDWANYKCLPFISKRFSIAASCWFDFLSSRFRRSRRAGATNRSHRGNTALHPTDTQYAEHWNIFFPNAPLTRSCECGVVGPSWLSMSLFFQFLMFFFHLITLSVRGKREQQYLFYLRAFSEKVIFSISAYSFIWLFVALWRYWFPRGKAIPPPADCL